MDDSPEFPYQRIKNKEMSGEDIYRMHITYAMSTCYAINISVAVRIASQSTCL